MKKIVVGIAAGRKYNNYLKWISQSPDLEVIKLSHEDDNLKLAGKCDGIILSGGEDVHPRFYGHAEFVEQYNLDDFDESRDDFELKLLTFTLQYQLPLLGICRGLQVANVFFGGTLVPDIPSSGKPDHTKFEEGKDRYHQIDVIEHSLLAEIAGTKSGQVNSAHHQSADKLGEGLIANAISPDGIIEGLERKEKSAEPFLLLVQWHPERMIDPLNPFSRNIRDSFLQSI